MEQKKYKQLTLEDRIEIYRLRAGGKSCRFIAGQLNKDVSTISRELRRNSKPTRTNPDQAYKPDQADRRALRRRHRPRGFVLEKRPDLAAIVRKGLVEDCLSPEQIAGRLRLLGGNTISAMSIYRYVYQQWRSREDPLYRALAKGHVRPRRPKPRAPNWTTIPHRVSIHDRPTNIRARATPGHWEADLIQFSTYGQSVVVHDRRSRFSVLLPQNRKTASAVADTLVTFFASLPPKQRQTLTLDNGPEFHAHQTVCDLTGLKTFFCDPYAPWQKGGVEHAIKRFRRDLPRKTDPATLTPDLLQRLSDRHNRTPRKCLGFLTPAEVFFNYKPVALTS